MGNESNEVDRIALNRLEAKRDALQTLANADLRTAKWAEELLTELDG